LERLQGGYRNAGTIATVEILLLSLRPKKVTKESLPEIETRGPDGAFLWFKRFQHRIKKQ
jgi:hypothetical protein